MDKQIKKNNISLLLKDIEGLTHDAVDMGIESNLSEIELLNVVFSTLKKLRSTGTIEKEDERVVLMSQTRTLQKRKGYVEVAQKAKVIHLPLRKKEKING